MKLGILPFNIYDYDKCLRSKYYLIVTANNGKYDPKLMLLNMLVPHEQLNRINIALPIFKQISNLAQKKGTFMFEHGVLRKKPATFAI